MIALDICQPHYQILLITYLKFIKKIQSTACLEEKHAKRKSIQSECDFIDLKKNKLRYKFKECKKTWLEPING